MKESNFKECFDNNAARKTAVDKKRAKSLIETSEERINLISEINQKNCNFVFEDYYTSLLELLQASAFLNGFNISNHICLGFYVRDFLKREDLFRLFDDLRYKRNSLTYYGIKMEEKIALQAIDNCKRMINEIKKIITN
ncbi:MAG: hypothetical protein QW757_03915 [Candidatus Woesearchaeota archaeon]